MKKLFTIILCLFSFTVLAQDVKSVGIDSTITSRIIFPDSVFRFNTSNPIAKRAALYSALLPGLGQAYNKQYWKLGLVGAGVGVATTFIIINNNDYKKYRNAYIKRIDNDPNTVDEFVGIYENEDLNNFQSEARRYVEYSVIFTVVGYALNVLDAYVAANLKSFDVGPSISLNAFPTYQNKQLGLALVVQKK